MLFSSFFILEYKAAEHKNILLTQQDLILQDQCWNHHHKLKNPTKSTSPNNLEEEVTEQ